MQFGAHRRSVPFAVNLVGHDKESMKHCCEEMERLLVEALVDRKLRGFLLFLLATRNQAYRTMKSNVCHLPFARDCIESLRGESTFLTVFGVGPSPDVGKSILSMDAVLEYQESFERQFPSCIIQVFEHSPEFPDVKSFVLISGSTHETVLSCRKTMKAIAS